LRNIAVVSLDEIPKATWVFAQEMLNESINNSSLDKKMTKK
jgi:hypothetical protein